MKRKNTLFFLIQSIAVLSFLLFFGGFVYAVKDIIQPQKNTLSPTAPVSTHTEGGILLSMGDSLTRGIGDAEGKGYIGVVREELQKKSNDNITLINLAVSGATSSEMLAQLEQPQVQGFVKDAKWITFTIGGNDLFGSTDRLAKMDKNLTDDALKKYSKNLRQILTKMRQLNPSAPIFVIGLYNPFGDLEIANQSTEIVAGWNEEIRSITASYHDVVLVPTFDLFQRSPKTYLYSDHFHPNDQGYERIATRLLQVMEEHD